MTLNSTIHNSIMQAVIDGKKPDHFYGQRTGLNTSRKRSSAKTRRSRAVLKMLKRVGL